MSSTGIFNSSSKCDKTESFQKIINLIKKGEVLAHAGKFQKIDAVEVDYYRTGGNELPSSSLLFHNCAVCRMHIPCQIFQHRPTKAEPTDISNWKGIQTEYS